MIVRAPGRRPRVGVRAELRLDDRGRSVAVAGLVRGEAALEVALPPLPRGVHSLGRARIASTWPSGLFRAVRPLDAAHGELVVYPAPAELPSARGGRQGLGDLLGGGATGFLQPTGMREYRPGDDRRRVHWRASARRGSLVVTEWEGGVGEGCEVLLDRRCAPEALEEALSVLAALAIAGREQKEPLTLHMQGHSATYGPSHRPWDELLRVLAEAGALPADGPAPPVVSPSVARLPVAAGAPA